MFCIFLFVLSFSIFLSIVIGTNDIVLVSGSGIIGGDVTTPTTITTVVAVSVDRTPQHRHQRRQQQQQSTNNGVTKLYEIGENCATNCTCLNDTSTIECINVFHIINARTMFNSNKIRVFINSYNNSVLESGRLNSGNRINLFSITHSLIKHVDPDCFAGEPDIEYLDLSFNKIETLHIDVFKSMLGLKVLNLSSNPLTTVEGSLLFDGKPLRNLQLLNIANTELFNQKRLFNFGRLPYTRKRFKLCVDSGMRHRRSTFFYTCNCKTRHVDTEACGQMQYIGTDNKECRAVTTMSIANDESPLLCNSDYFSMREFVHDNGARIDNSINYEMRTGTAVEVVTIPFDLSTTLSSLNERLSNIIANVVNTKIFLYVLVVVVFSILIICTCVVIYRYSILDLLFWKFCCFCRRDRYKRHSALTRRKLTKDDLTVLRRHPDGTIVRRPIVRCERDVSESPLNVGVLPTSIAIANENYYLTPISLSTQFTNGTNTRTDIASCINDPANRHTDTDAIIYDTGSVLSRKCETTAKSSSVYGGSNDYAFDDYWDSEFDFDYDDDGDDKNNQKPIADASTFQNVPLPPIPTNSATANEECIYTEIVE